MVMGKMKQANDNHSQRRSAKEENDCVFLAELKGH